jgi:hypothetical protein
VKTIRIWLLVLLAVLLPVRGAVAAAMLCPPANPAHEHADHQHAEHDADAPGASGHDDGFGKCNLCCDLCSMTPMLSALPSIPTPLNLSSVSFPDLFAPAPSFLSDGQERPPRSI